MHEPAREPRSERGQVHHLRVQRRLGLVVRKHRSLPKDVSSPERQPGDLGLGRQRLPRRHPRGHRDIQRRGERQRTRNGDGRNHVRGSPGTRLSRHRRDNGLRRPHLDSFAAHQALRGRHQTDRRPRPGARLRERRRVLLVRRRQRGVADGAHRQGQVREGRSLGGSESSGWRHPRARQPGPHHNLRPERSGQRHVLARRRQLREKDRKVPRGRPGCRLRL